MSCPIKSNKDWKALVAKVGEQKAYLEYVKNGNQVPASKTVKREINKGIGNNIEFSNPVTTSLINEYPSLAKEIIDDLVTLFPDVVFSKEGIIDKNGKFVEIEAGKQGMHYRNAFISMVSWANDSFLETPPHEYAHHYIDMFRNHPLVAIAIEKYGEEKLVEKISKRYTKEYTSPAFSKWVNKFWTMTRSLFGIESINDKIYKAFKENKKLSKDEYKGTATVRFQDKPKIMNKKSQADISKQSNIKRLVKNVLTISDEAGLNSFKKFFKKIQSTEDSPNKTDKIRNFFLDKIEILKKTDLDDKLKYMDLSELDSYDLNLFKDNLTNDQTGFQYSNYFALKLSGASDTSIFIDDFFKAINSSTIKDFQNKYEIDSKLYFNIHKRIEYNKQQKENLLLDDGKLVSVSAVEKEVLNDIDEASKNRKRRYNKGLLSINSLENIFRLVTKGVNVYLMSPRLKAKLITGKNLSLLQKITYDSFNEALNKQNKILQNFYEKFQTKKLSNKIKSRSFHFSKKTKIDEFKGTYEIKQEGRKFKITEAEILNIYFLARNDYRSLIESGVYLEDDIEGRKYDKTIKITDQIIKDIEEIVNNSNELSEVITKIDNGIKVIFDARQENHKKVNPGFEIEEKDNYFPSPRRMSTNTSSKPSIQNFRSLNSNNSSKKRPGSTKPYLVRDVFRIMDNMARNESFNASFEIPIRNAKLLLDKVMTAAKRQNVKDSGLINKTLDGLNENVTRIQDNTEKTYGKNESQFLQFLKRKRSNFVAYVLGHGIPVLFKQPVSLLAAATVIDPKFLSDSMLNKVIPKTSSVFEAYKESLGKLEFSPPNKGHTVFPFEWVSDPDEETSKEMEAWSPTLFLRTSGTQDFSIEMNEATSEAGDNNDFTDLKLFGVGKYLKNIIRGKNENSGSENLRISKSRGMQGIRVFDTTTIKKIWRGAKREAKEVYGITEQDGAIFWEHVAARSEQITNETQPTYDLNNRSGLSAMGSKNETIKTLTMFSSAREKMPNMMMERMIEYVNEPNDVNKRKLTRTVATVSIGVALFQASIQEIFNSLNGWLDDDDEPELDEIPESIALEMLRNNLGNIHGAGTAGNGIVSYLDNEPWHQTTQYPVFQLLDNMEKTAAYGLKSDPKVFESMVKYGLMYKGIPGGSYKVVSQAIKKIAE